MTDLYDYGPPVQVSDGGVPSADTGEAETGVSGSATTDTGTTAFGTSGSLGPESTLDPSISGLAPATAVINTSTPVSVNGANFTTSSVVLVDGVPQDTTFVTNSQVRATLLSSTAKTVQLSVINGVNVSNTSPFTFTATGE